MTLVVGITGGIGSGKSTFSKEVYKRKIKLLDSDKQVSVLYKNPKKNFLNYLSKIGLRDAIKKNRIDKKLIAKIIFSNKKVKTELEKYIFKIVRETRSKFIKIEKKRKTKIVFLDIPLLFENGLENQFDIIVTIISKKKERLKRLKYSKKISKKIFHKIIKSQVSDVERISKSDIIIYNNKTMADFIKKINKTIDNIVS